MHSPEKKDVVIIGRSSSQGRTSISHAHLAQAAVLSELLWLTI